MALQAHPPPRQQSHPSCPRATSHVPTHICTLQPGKDPTAAHSWLSLPACQAVMAAGLVPSTHCPLAGLRLMALGPGLRCELACPPSLPPSRSQAPPGTSALAAGLRGLAGPTGLGCRLRSVFAMSLSGLGASSRPSYLVQKLEGALSGAGQLLYVCTHVGGMWAGVWP